jgi:hypothetical protein
MTNRAQRVGLTATWLAAFAIAAGAQLNPTVTLLSSPASPVPSDCDQSVAPQAMPRVQVAEIPEPPKRNATAAPPTASVRAQLKDVQNAADRNDRDAFRDALARVKATVGVYPAGGEKAAAGDVIRVYDDLDRIWTWQMDSKTGAFFEAGSIPAQIMRGYPGFEGAIADQILVNANTRFYPTAETREFLVREAAQRLKKLGVTVATRAPRPARVLPRFATVPARTPAATAKPAEHHEPTTQAATTTRRAGKHGTASRKHRAETKIAEANEKPIAKPTTAKATGEPSAPSAPTSKHSQPKVARETAQKPTAKAPTKQAAAETPNPAPTKSPAPPPAVATSSPTPVPSIAATSAQRAASEPETTSASSSATQPAPAAAASAATTATTGTTAAETTASQPATDTSASAETTDTTGTAGKGQPQSKGVILPIILIVIGIGVLIVLFRASS